MPAKVNPPLELTPDLEDARASLDWLVRQLNPLQVRFRVGQGERQQRTLPLDEMQVQFRRLVTEWQECNWSLLKMFRRNQPLSGAADCVQVSIYPKNAGGASLRWAMRNDPTATPKQKAMGYFLEFVTNPLWRSLAGPCKECEQYFVRESARNRGYCSKKCSSRQTARTAGRQRIERERIRKIRIAEVRLARWSDGSRREDWKRFVARDPELTVRWITTAVTRGDLSPPLEHRFAERVRRSSR